MNAIKEAPKPKTTNGRGATKDVTPPATVSPTTYATPFGFMRKFTEELDRVFEQFGLEAGWLMPRMFTHDAGWQGKKPVPATEWMPRIEAFERAGQFVVRADLPGLSKEDIKVEVAPGYITVEGERKVEKKEEREGYYYGECHYGSFQRAIPLPEGVDTTRATADFHKGVLEIVMPKAAVPEARTRRLEVREVK